MRTILTLLLVSSMVLACGEKSKRESSGAILSNNDRPQTADQQPAPSGPTSSSSGSKPTSTVLQCNEAGQAFAAVVLPGESPTGCVGQLAPFGCCPNVVGMLFANPELIADVNGKMQSKITEGMQLYNCEMVSEKKFRFHFAKSDSPGTMRYAHVIGEGTTNPLNGIEPGCPQIPDTSFLQGIESQEQGESGDLQIAFSDIKTLLVKNCAACHAADQAFMKDKTEFKAHSAEVKARLLLPAGDPKRMPQINEKFPEDMDETERAALILYIDKYLD